MLRFMDMFLVVVAFAITTTSARLHLAHHGLLQIHPSFRGDAITLYPSHHPDHDTDDLLHIQPQHEHLLYYSQEGHRPAIHGAKHSSFQAKFVRPTVVLDHTSHLNRVDCRRPGDMTVCFSSSEAFKKAQTAWNMPDFNIATFHLGCGDELSGERSYFHAKRPTAINHRTKCLVIPTKRIQHTDALDSGEITWGTYIDPKDRRRTPVLGHIKLSEELRSPLLRRQDPPDEDDPNEGSPPNDAGDTPADGNGDAPPDDGKPDDGNPEDGNPSGDEELHFPGDEPPSREQLDEYLAMMKMPDSGPTMDIENNMTAMEEFFGLDDDEMPEQLPPDEYLPFVDEDGTIPFEDPKDNQDSTTGSEEPPVTTRSLSTHIEKRGIFDFLITFIHKIVNLIRTFTEIVAAVVKVLGEIAVISAKLVAAAFGAPFDHSYHNDFQFQFQPKGSSSGDEPPKIFNSDPGVEIAGTSGEFSVQCLKCGISGDFSIDGALAFSIKDGLTKGKLELTNKKPFTLDAQFGIHAKLQTTKSLPIKKDELGSLPLSPLAIPGLLVLGPQLSLSAELEVALEGEADLMVGGSLSISPGTATLDAIDGARNGIKGLNVSFTPLAKFEGSLTASLEFGLPVAIECGINVLNGKFKKTIGLVEKPVVYVSATASNQDDAVCDGVELRVGVKNEIYLSAFDVYEKPLLETTIYEQGLGCVNSDGFDATKVRPKEVFKGFGKDGDTDTIERSPPTLRNVTIKIPETKAGYRLITDKDRSHILVAGSDSFVYLVDNKESYDYTAPWGTLELESKAFSLDVLDRFMAGPTYAFSYGVARMVMLKDKQVPRHWTVAGLKSVKDGDRERLAVAVHNTDYNGKVHLTLRFPTFCKTVNGTKLYATRCLMGDEGKWKDDAGKPCEEAADHNEVMMNVFNVTQPTAKNCRTIQLVV